MSSNAPEVVICRYTVKSGFEEKLERLLARHWPALDAEGLVTGPPSQIYRSLPDASDPGGAPNSTVYVEIFTWKSGDAPEIAHHLPSVLAIWEPMGALCEKMEFPHFERLPASQG